MEGQFVWQKSCSLKLMDPSPDSPVFYSKIETVPESGKRAESDLLHALDLSSLITFTDVDGNFTYVNDNFCEISKYSREELIGKNYRVINSGYHSKNFWAELWNTIAAGKVWKGEINNRAKDGSFYWVFATIVPFLDKQGKPEQYVSILMEIMDKKRLEEAVERNKSRFDLKQLQLENELQEQLCSILTHDLRTPLTAAKVAVGLIERRSKDPDMVNALTTRVLKNIDRIDHMITDFLDAQRIKSKQGLVLNRINCDLQSVVKNAIDELNIIHGDRFSLKVSGNMNGFWCPAGLQRLVENLCSNGVKYGYANTPVTICLIGNEKEIELSVHNFGDPISSEDQAGLFQYLHRTEAAQKNGTKGWGIGLIIVRGITEAHGGRVTVNSSRDLGTTFIVTLPRFQSEH